MDFKKLEIPKRLNLSTLSSFAHICACICVCGGGWVRRWHGCGCGYGWMGACMCVWGGMDGWVHTCMCVWGGT